MIKLLEEIDELLTFLEDTAHGEEGKRITEMRYKILTELSNSHKHGVMQGLPTENEISAMAILTVNLEDSDTAKIIHRAAFESGARWAISELSGSPTVASGAVGSQTSAWACPMCRALTINTNYEGYCCQSCFDGA